MGTFIDRCRGEKCPNPVPVHPIEPSVLHTFAGTQRMQADLPEATQVAWRAVAAAFPRANGLGAWGDRAHAARKSCHNTGRAIDVMTIDPRLHAQIVAWALANRSKYKITLIISRRRKWSAVGKWSARPYLGVSPHNDHVHLSIDCDG